MASCCRLGAPRHAGSPPPPGSPFSAGRRPLRPARLTIAPIPAASPFLLFSPHPAPTVSGEPPRTAKLLSRRRWPLRIPQVARHPSNLRRGCFFSPAARHRCPAAARPAFFFGEVPPPFASCASSHHREPVLTPPDLLRSVKRPVRVGA
ncbi:hypothetical protein NL676_008614 [Syzygium grande]|nr:hypothetical protein NL676_008614 [Syzygium grande]